MEIHISGNSYRKIIGYLMIYSAPTKENSPIKRVKTASSIQSKSVRLRSQFYSPVTHHDDFYNNKSTKHYKRNSDVKQVLDYLSSNSSKPLFVTGEAGSGKSALIRYLKSIQSFSNIAVLAPTGLTALQIGGKTIHSFFQFPHHILDQSTIKNLSPNRELNGLDLIIIDEISMVRADVIDAIDVRLRISRESNTPFGGCKMLFLGDFYQLPPVVTEQEHLILSQIGYKLLFAYGARVFEAIGFNKISLKNAYRQKPGIYLEALRKLRCGVDISSTLELINECCFSSHRAGFDPIVITCTKRRADEYNFSGLSSLGGEICSYQAEIYGKFDQTKITFPAPYKLDLKVGAQVIAGKNDPAKRFFNGSLGRVKSLCNGQIVVDFHDGVKNCIINKETWDVEDQVWLQEEQKIKNYKLGTYTQFPILPAWALNIHKIQGLTFEDIRIDFYGGTFADGQAYTALSRVKSIAGLSLVQPIRISDIRVDKTHDNLLRDMPQQNYII